MVRFSRPVRFSSTAAYWPASPKSGRTAVALATTSWPSTSAVPAVGLEYRGEDPNDGRLAGAVRSEEAEDRALLDLEADAVERSDTALEGLLEILHTYCGRHAAPPRDTLDR